jgi:asparagine synthase (glutamine-hydrolysing)
MLYLMFVRLTDSVAQRVKAPYPSIQDPVYAGRLQRTAREQLADPAHPVFGLVSRDWLTRATAPGAEVTPDTRLGIERTMDLALWLGHVPANPETLITALAIPSRGY